jgi:hypothetical protein
VRTAFQRWCLIAAASSLYFFLAYGGIFAESALGDLVAGYGPAYYAVLWVADDARRTRYWPAYHYGLFLLMLWPLAIPHHVLRTRGRSGLGLACGTFALELLPFAAAFLGAWFYADLPDLRE